jgi:adenylate kinase
MNLIILGPQGSGKGTQAKFLADHFNLVHIDMGLALRQAAEENTPLGSELHRIIYEEKGLVSDEEIIKVLEEMLKSIPQEKGVIIDGAPRRIGQIELVENAFKNSGRNIDKVILLNISEEESIQRISHRFNCEKCNKGFFLGEDLKDPEKGCPVCGGKVVRRKDDTEEGVRKRLSIFHEETYPVVEYYRAKGGLIEINGMNNKNEVSNEILEKLKI